MQLRFCTTVLLAFIVSPVNAQKRLLSFTQSEGEVAIKVNDQSIASYIYNDKQILRPYFAHVKAPGGAHVTRNHPPESTERDDHATMHPGIWLAFADLSGNDFWRNKAIVKHVKFIQQPASERNMGSFVEQKHYMLKSGKVVCEEEFRFAIRADQDAYFFILESIFTANSDCYFGDQEEMGLGVRVATPISEAGGGKLIDSESRQTAQQIWGNTAAWCDYSGEVEGQRVGMTIMSHPTNFRESWWHARDYGLLAANPFGRAAMKQGVPSKVHVKPGGMLRLRYAVWVHADTDPAAMTKAYNEYARLGR